MINHSLFVGVHASTAGAGSSPLPSTSTTVMVCCAGIKEETGRELGAVVSGVPIFSLSTTEYVSNEYPAVPLM
jgi:hypothetical protein